MYQYSAAMTLISVRYELYVMCKHENWCRFCLCIKYDFTWNCIYSTYWRHCHTNNHCVQEFKLHCQFLDRILLTTQILLLSKPMFVVQVFNQSLSISQCWVNHLLLLLLSSQKEQDLRQRARRKRRKKRRSRHRHQMRVRAWTSLSWARGLCCWSKWLHSSATGGAQISVSRLNMKIGRILAAKNHPDADTLYVEEGLHWEIGSQRTYWMLYLTVDVGEGTTRTVVSGLVNHVPLDQMQVGTWLQQEYTRKESPSFCAHADS